MSMRRLYPLVSVPRKSVIVSEAKDLGKARHGRDPSASAQDDKRSTIWNQSSLSFVEPHGHASARGPQHGGIGRWIVIDYPHAILVERRGVGHDRAMREEARCVAHEHHC